MKTKNDRKNENFKKSKILKWSTIAIISSLGITNFSLGNNISKEEIIKKFNRVNSDKTEFSINNPSSPNDCNLVDNFPNWYNYANWSNWYNYANWSNWYNYHNSVENQDYIESNNIFAGNNEFFNLFIETYNLKSFFTAFNKGVVFYDNKKIKDAKDYFDIFAKIFNEEFNLETKCKTFATNYGCSYTELNSDLKYYKCLLDKFFERINEKKV